MGHDAKEQICILCTRLIYGCKIKNRQKRNLSCRLLFGPSPMKGCNMGNIYPGYIQNSNPVLNTHLTTVVLRE